MAHDPYVVDLDKNKFFESERKRTANVQRER